jgi:hypothetical protein
LKKRPIKNYLKTLPLIVDMDFMLLVNVMSIINLILEIASIIFITFVFFDLIYIDRTYQLTSLSEKFEKLKRYDVFKASLIFLVLSLYFNFFSKISIYLEFPTFTFGIFTFIANLFLLLFVFKLYTLLHKYVPEAENAETKDAEKKNTEKEKQ